MKKVLCLIVVITSLVALATQCYTKQYKYYGTTCNHYHGSWEKNYYPCNLDP